jgi:hypothetical protein
MKADDTIREEFKKAMNKYMGSSDEESPSMDEAIKQLSELDDDQHMALIIIALEGARVRGLLKVEHIIPIGLEFMEIKFGLKKGDRENNE